MGQFHSIVVEFILPLLFNFVTQHLLYPFTADGNMRALKSAVKSLVAKEKDVKEKIVIAERGSGGPTNQSSDWFDRVKDTKTQVGEMVEIYKQRCLCFKCFLWNFYYTYSLSKTAAEKLRDVQRLLDEGEKIAPAQFAMTPAPPHVQEEPVPPSSPNANPNLKKALRYIKDDPVGIIGIWGMGGVGKTHLLKQINNSFIWDSAFNHVILVTASQSCTTEAIQMQIAENLKLQPDGDVSRQAKIIFNFLKNKSFLLLLDDLWERLDLQVVGIPFPLGMVGGCKRKVVLTTRLVNVCGEMEVRKKIKVKCLNDDDAWSLFLEKVGEETIKSHRLIPRLAKEVIKELEGLPLALITTGRAMYDKKDPREWEYAIDLLKKSRLDEVEHSPENQEGSTFCRLKFSYDSLKPDTLRECFLSCSMWPEDWWIRKGDLVECWMGLGLIGEFDNISEAYNTGHTLISYLTRACLLEENEEEGRVRMHDVLRDMALWITRDEGKKKKNKWMVYKHEAPRDKEIWHKAERITLMQSNIQAFPPIATTSFSSELTTLMLSRNHNLRKLGDNIGALVALTYLDLSHCGFIHFPKEICGLVQLRFLNLADNKISSLPVELGSLVNLKFLILRVNRIRTIPQGAIAKLKSLQVLDLHQNWRSIGENLTCLASQLLEELECLNNLKGLGICVGDTSQLRRLVELPNVLIRWLGISKLGKSTSFSLWTSFLGDEQIQMYLAELCFMNSNVTQMVIEGSHQRPTWQLRALEKLEFHELGCLEEIIWKGVVPEELFRALRHLTVNGCHKLKSISWVLHLPCLRFLEVVKCYSMRELIACGAENHGENVANTVEKEEEKGITSTPTFPCLRMIHLDNLPEMVFICHSSFALPALIELYIINCPKLKKLPFRPGNIPSKLRAIYGSKRWWEECLEWEDSSVKTSLQPLYIDPNQAPT